jgi:hypothetical protein
MAAVKIILSSIGSSILISVDVCEKSSGEQGGEGRWVKSLLPLPPN